MRVLVVVASVLGAWPAFAQTAPKGYSNKLAPYVASPARVMDRMLELANIKPGETLYDLGCGDGRILIAAVQKYNITAVGVEISPRLVAKASASIRKAGLENKARVIQGDVLNVDPTGADVVYLYLSTRANEQLRPSLEAHLKAGARVVSHDYAVPGWKPTKVEETEGSQRHMIYLYEMPPSKQ
jgi:SAM-dependent methyltransferase